ncbi:MAG: hypothetical protein OIF32_06295 [Campylobacterales bacterium]|nr:hypothetical protein [Campylobacterales bacterium]
MSLDLNMWQEEPIDKICQIKESKKEYLKDLKKVYQDLKENKSYKNFHYEKSQRKPKIEEIEKESLGLGMCPVASEKTRCCNLMTLDAIESCGFDCSYCSIQSFYNGDKITFDKSFSNKLESLELDPNKTYHIGTGQSSDSLLYGNKNGALEAVIEFAKKNKNVILELKSKSKNIEYLLKNEIPRNLIVTWSMNTPTIIENEEHLSATLEERIESARRVSDKGILVGFHFHPMVYYEGWEEEYSKVYQLIQENFKPEEVVLISIGTLTFIKPVIKKLRERKFSSKILQMDMVDAEGKFSYPLEIKEKMFKHLYDGFKDWHKKVYFYMCMENKDLWQKIFGYEYSTNEEFEDDMIQAYKEKIWVN